MTQKFDKIVKQFKTKKNSLNESTSSEKNVEFYIQDLILDDESGDGPRVSTFEDAGIMTNNAGLVLDFEDGSQYQITIVKSK
jgi:hypothetical protein